jgi:hypothetical protein
MRGFWPPGEAAQVDYEQLRSAVLKGRALISVAAARFEHRGLCGLILKPAAEPVFSARLRSAPRPPWTPYGDPRLAALCDAYELILHITDSSTQETGT